MRQAMTGYTMPHVLLWHIYKTKHLSSLYMGSISSESSTLLLNQTQTLSVSLGLSFITPIPFSFQINLKLVLP
jgi:hypothetical protein